MPLQQIARWNHCLTSTVTFTSSISTTGGFGFNSYAGGMLMVTLGSGTLTFYVRPSDGASDSYEVNSGGAAVTLDVVAGKAYPLPDALFGASYVQAITGGTAVACKVLLKG